MYMIILLKFNKIPLYNDQFVLVSLYAELFTVPYNRGRKKNVFDNRYNVTFIFIVYKL
jgi:hypothetical protein